MNYLWKEWKEQTRGKGLWLALAMVILLSITILLQSYQLPSIHGFSVFLLSLQEMNMFILPLIGLFISSFAIMQEKELKTLMILTTKKESYRSFLYKKSMSIHLVTLAVFTFWYFLFALPMKFFFHFDIQQFGFFLVSVFAFLIIFNQIGLFVGSVCKTKMQLVGANIFTWFLFVFLIDLFFMYLLPYITYENVKVFSFFFFLDPMHTVPFFLETSIGTFPLTHLSRLMDKMVWASPTTYLLIMSVFWTVASFELAVFFKNKGEKV